MTAPGVPMFLAGEEFADVHDLDHTDWRLKMSDPVGWSRANEPGPATLRPAIAQLVALRTSHPSLQRDEVEITYVHPAIDDNDGVRVFAYCRMAGRPAGSPGQVVVVANMGPHEFPAFDLPWPWQGGTDVREQGAPAAGAPLRVRAHDGSGGPPLSPLPAPRFSPQARPPTPRGRPAPPPRPGGGRGPPPRGRGGLFPP